MTDVDAAGAKRFDRGGERGSEHDARAGELKIFVGGIPHRFDHADLKQEFQRYGASRATVMIDRKTGRSRGFGFVYMTDPTQVDKAISRTNGMCIDGRPISVAKAVPEMQTLPGTPASLLASGMGVTYGRAPRPGGDRFRNAPEAKPDHPGRYSREVSRELPREGSQRELPREHQRDVKHEAPRSADRERLRSRGPSHTAASPAHSRSRSGSADDAAAAAAGVGMGGAMHVAVQRSSSLGAGGSSAQITPPGQNSGGGGGAGGFGGSAEPAGAAIELAEMPVLHAAAPNPPWEKAMELITWDDPSTDRAFEQYLALCKQILPGSRPETKPGIGRHGETQSTRASRWEPRLPERGERGKPHVSRGSRKAAERRDRDREQDRLRAGDRHRTERIPERYSRSLKK